MREVRKGGQRPRWGHARLETGRARPVEGARTPRKEGAYAWEGAHMPGGACTPYAWEEGAYAWEGSRTLGGGARTPGGGVCMPAIRAHAWWGGAYAWWWRYARLGGRARLQGGAHA
jgi:hypothetical protein